MLTEVKKKGGTIFPNFAVPLSNIKSKLCDFLKDYDH